MKNTIKICLAFVLIISAIFAIGIISVGATVTETDYSIIVESGVATNMGTKIVYDPDTKVMTFSYIGDTSPHYEISPATSAGDYTVHNFIDKFRTEVEHVEMGYFKKITLVDVSGTDDCGKLFAGMTSLKSIHFAEKQNLQNGMKGAGFFEDCESLTTIWFGDDSNKIEGCANFTDDGTWDNNYKDRNNFPRNLFKGCASLESVIYTTNQYEFAILPTTFSGCASLKEVTIGSNITNITADAFMNTGVLVVNAPEGSAAASIELPSLMERIEAFKAAGNTAKNEDYTYIQNTNKEWVKSNIKWEIYNLGTETAPKYTIYFYIDADSTNEATTSLRSLANIAYEDAGSLKNRYIRSTGEVLGGYAGDYGSGKYHRWHSDAIPATSISAIVLGDGIAETDYKTGAFSGMTGVEVVECPSSYINIKGTTFKACSSLETLYTRGVNSPEIGTLNFSAFQRIPLGLGDAYNTNSGFAGLKSVKKYIFVGDYYTAKSTSATPEAIFYDNESLESITLPVGTLGIAVNTFANCTSLKEVIIPDNSKNSYSKDKVFAFINAGAFTNCTSLEEIVFKNGNGVTIAVDSAATNVTGRPKATESLDTNAFKGCSALTTLTAPVGTDVYNFAMEHGFNTTDSYVESAHIGRFTVSGTHLTATDTGYNEKASWRQPNYQDTGLLEFLNSYDATIETASINLPAKFLLDTSYEGIFEGMTALREVQFAADMRIAISGTLDPSANQHGFFKDCSALTTVWFGSEAYRTVGVVDLKNINLKDMPGDASGNILYYMFSGCSSIEKIILPELTEHLNWKGSYTIYPRIWADTFAGCTSLKEVNIPEGMGIIDNGAFKDCTALTTINYYAPASLIGASTFTGTNNGLVLKVQSYNDANTINGVLIKAGVTAGSVRAFYKNGISLDNYQVRTIGKNGLRTNFTFYKNAFEGYTLVECGTLTGTAANWASYTETFGEENSVLTLVGGEYKPAHAKIVKTPIYQNGGYVNNYIETSDGVRFSVTVVDMTDKDQYTAEVVSCGYEIWKQGDNTYVYFTREEAEGYETASLYKITLGMLEAQVITLEGSGTPVYDTLMACDKTAFASQDGVQSYYFADPLDSTKKKAVYVTSSTIPVTLENIGFDLSEKPNISGMIFGKNVIFDLPVIEDDYWQEEIDTQLAKIPDGKSFIAFTDFHFELDGTRNSRKATELMKYVKTIAGIDTVINLGDTYTGEPTISESKEIFDLSVGEYYYDVFGTDGLYAVGNHESNITTWGGAKKDNDEAAGTVGKYAYDVLLPDTDIYDGTIANLYGKEGFVFNDALIELADSGSITFSEVGPYSAEQMKAEYIAWAKMHYYYDDTENGIRYIIYNSGNCGITEKYTLGSQLWNSIYGTQIDFIANALMSVPSDYDVVLAGHMLGHSTYNKNDNVRDVAIYKLLSAFKSGTSFNHIVSSSWGNENLAAVVGNATKSYDFSSKNFTGTIFTIGGHWHVDFSCVYGTDENGTYQSNQFYTEGDETSEDAIFWIGLNNDCLEVLQDYEKEPTAVVEMMKGTNTENCFNVITITTDGDIVVTRFGAGEDRKFIYTQKKNNTVNNGISFSAENTYTTAKKIEAYPKTVEAVITLPEDHSGRAGVIFGSYGGGFPCFNFEIVENGKPRIYMAIASDDALSVYPNVDVRTGEPIHVAVVIDNFDAEALTADIKCYINGELETTDTGKKLYADFPMSGFAIGGDFRALNGQYFKGTIISASAYADARTAEEIAADYKSFGSGDPLFCYELSESDNEMDIADKSGNGYDLSYSYVGFLESKEAVSDYAYSMAVVGDTQKVSYNNQANFNKIYDYIINNVEEKNIQFVIGLGDITEKDTAEEWTYDMAQIKRMDDVVPYSLVRGNHDGVTNSNFDTYVSYDGEKTAFAGAYEEGSELNTYHTFSVCNINYMVMCLDYGASDAVLEWAGDVIAAHPDHNVIVTTHVYLYRDGTTLDDGDLYPPSVWGESYNDGDDMWEKLVKNHSNIVLVLSGHDPSSEIVMTKATGINGNTVTQMLIDPQGADAAYKDLGGLGLVAMFYFSEDGRTVQVEYYSTIQEKYFMYTNQFTFELDVVS